MTLHQTPPHPAPLDLFWFIPVSGDGSYLGTTEGHRPADFRYLKEPLYPVSRTQVPIRSKSM